MLATEPTAMAVGAIALGPRRPFARTRTSDKLSAYLDAHTFDMPTLVLDVDRAVANFTALKGALAPAHIHYAVKANPEPQLVRRLVAQGCRFDAASRGEIELCLDAGALPSDISFGNTVKKVSDIAWAHARGIDLFAADATEELDKLAVHAPGARVYIRLLVEASQADWPLSRKFGVPGSEVIGLMHYARAHGLRPVGMSFHVGSQTRRSAMWQPVLEEAAGVWHDANAQGFALDVLDIGGGFPTFYGDEIEDAVPYGNGVMDQVRRYFGDVGYVMAEPGRSIAGDAGAIAAEVLLVARKRPTDIARWVYLDIGKFSGLAETIDEAIRYQIDTSADEGAEHAKDGGPMGPCILAGPSCDSADVLYEKRPVMLPVSLRAGDRVRILNCGAYTTTYSSVGFNGFPPLAVVCI